MRMRGGEIMQGRRRKYRRNEDRIEQFKANNMQDQITDRNLVLHVVVSLELLYPVPFLLYFHATVTFSR